MDRSGGERAPARAEHLRIDVHLVPLIECRGARRQQCGAEEGVSQNRPVKRDAASEPVSYRRTDENKQRDSWLRQLQVVSHVLIFQPDQPMNYEGDEQGGQKGNVCPIRDGPGQGFYSVIHTETASFRGESICIERIVPAATKTTVTQVHINAAAHCWSSSGERPACRGVHTYMGYATRSEKTSKPERTSHGSVAAKRYKSIDHRGHSATDG